MPGAKTPVMLKGGGAVKNEAMDAASPVHAGFLSQRLVEFSDGSPIPAECFSERADQPLALLALVGTGGGRSFACRARSCATNWL